MGRKTGVSRMPSSCFFGLMGLRISHTIMTAVICVGAECHSPRSSRVRSFVLSFRRTILGACSHPLGCTSPVSVWYAYTRVNIVIRLPLPRLEQRSEIFALSDVTPCRGVPRNRWYAQKWRFRLDNNALHNHTPTRDIDSTVQGWVNRRVAARNENVPRGIEFQALAWASSPISVSKKNIRK